MENFSNEYQGFKEKLHELEMFQGSIIELITAMYECFESIPNKGEKLLAVFNTQRSVANFRQATLNIGSKNV